MTKVREFLFWDYVKLFFTKFIPRNISLDYIAI